MSSLPLSAHSRLSGPTSSSNNRTTRLRSAAFRPQVQHKHMAGLHRSAVHRSYNRLPQQAPSRELELAAGPDTDTETAPLAGPSSSQHRDPAAVAESHDYIDWLATGACFAFPAIGGLLFGYDIGATSGVLVSLTSEKLSGTDWYQLSSFQSGLVVSASLFGALAGSLAALAAGNRIGRRTELLIASLLYGLSAATMGFAGSLPVLLAGRVTYGIGMGFAMHAAPAYIAETSPPRVRGKLISLKEAAIVGGILAGYLSSYVFIGGEGGWRSMYGAAAPLALLLGIGMFNLPESPRWLLLNGAGKEAATQALIKAEGKRADNRAVVEAEVAAISAGLAEGGGGGNMNVLDLFKEERYWRPTLVGMSLMLFQQITGQPSVLYYATKIFEDAGFAAGQESTGISVVLGGFKLLMTLVAVATVDSWGRRPLLLWGVGGLTAALVVLGSTQAGLAPGDGAVSAWTSVAALLLYVGCYQVSFGPISWLIVGEVFPLNVRGQALALATFVNFGSNFLVSLALPTVQEAIGMSATYFGFAAIGGLALTSIYLTVPETRGKTLEEIEQIWGTTSSDSSKD